MARINQQLLDNVAEKKYCKDTKRDLNREGCTVDNSYMADMDLPPMDSDDDEYYDEVEESDEILEEEVGYGKDLGDNISS